MSTVYTLGMLTSNSERVSGRVEVINTKYWQMMQQVIVTQTRDPCPLVTDFD